MSHPGPLPGAPHEARRPDLALVVEWAVASRAKWSQKDASMRLRRWIAVEQMELERGAK